MKTKTPVLNVKVISLKSPKTVLVNVLKELKKLTVISIVRKRPNQTLLSQVKAVNKKRKKKNVSLLRKSPKKDLLVG